MIAGGNGSPDKLVRFINGKSLEQSISSGYEDRPGNLKIRQSINSTMFFIEIKGITKGIAASFDFLYKKYSLI